MSGQVCSSISEFYSAVLISLRSDFYDEASVMDLRRFFDHYMKGINNDWKYTPPVRMCVQNPGGSDIMNRPEQTFPLERQVPLKLFLNAGSSTLQESPLPTPSTISYDSMKDEVQFKMTVPSYMELTGYIKLRIWVEAQGADDMDIFASLAKYNSESGKVMESLLVDVGRLSHNPEPARKELLRRHAADPKDCDGYFDSGPMGCLRASHRELDEEKSSLFHPVYSHRKIQLLQPGEIVPLDIAFWPYGMVCNAGEELRLTISGRNMKEHLRPNDCRPVLCNKGNHVVHTGGGWDSYLLLPLVSV